MNTAPNWSQVSGVVERAVLALLMYAAGRGWVSSADVSNIVAFIVGLLGLIYAYYVNRPKNLAKQAASLPDTTVVTIPEIAESTSQKNIVSNADVKVQQK